MKTYGTIEFNPKKKLFEIECQPHVSIRLKRVFAKIRVYDQGTLVLSATPENAFDLNWFLQRYPMVIPQQTFFAMQDRMTKWSERESIVEKILRQEKIDLEFKMLKLPPREYQAQATAMWLAAGGLLLADDVGLGKTLMAIAGLTDPRTRPALVTTLTHLPFQWRDEVFKFTDLNVHILKKSTPYDLCDQFTGRMPDVIVSNYHKLSGWYETLAPLIKSVVFDEVQELRHRGTNKYRAAEYIAQRVNFRLGLSATPIYNYGGEIYSVINIIQPDALGEFAEFQREWCEYDDQKPKIKDPTAFGIYARDAGLMLRRTRKEVGRELPPVTVVPHYIDANPEAIMAMEGNAINLAKIILQQKDDFKGQRMRASGEFDMKMRQATGIAKCLAFGTLVLKYDGSVVAVETLKIGDLLMGPDSKPRRILTTTEGEGEMFEIAPDSKLKHPHFESYKVNSDHILSLKHTGKIRKGDLGLFGPYLKYDHLEIPVKDYLGKSRWFKHCVKSYKVGVEFPERPLPLDPYFLGLWLGDGSSDYPEVTTADPEIVDYLHRFAHGMGLVVTVNGPERTAPTYKMTTGKRGGDPKLLGSKNPLLNVLRSLRVLHNKHIPTDYLMNSRENRLKLLAGLLDSDGSLASGGYCISSKWKHLAEQIRYLSRSLGFASQTNPEWCTNQSGKQFLEHDVTIYGEGLVELPLLIPRKRAAKRRQIKDPLRGGLTVISKGWGAYYGFALDGDGLFLLGDFTVTHNSPFVADFVRMLVEDNNEPVILFGWHRDVYNIWMEKLRDLKPVLFTGTEDAKEKETNKQAFLRGDTKVFIISLRAGAGVDGLQEVCHIGVFGELDWSPGVHEQCIGRFARDGQLDPMTAYYLLSTVGSDPFISDMLGVKKQQIEGMRDPNQDLVTKLEVDPGHIKKLAAHFLQQHGVAPAASVGG